MVRRTVRAATGELLYALRAGIGLKSQDCAAAELDLADLLELRVRERFGPAAFFSLRISQ